MPAERNESNCLLDEALRTGAALATFAERGRVVPELNDTAIACSTRRNTAACASTSQNEAAIRRAFNDILARARDAGLLDALDGVLIQPMIVGGVETMIGVAADRLFGPRWDGRSGAFRPVNAGLKPRATHRSARL